ncbi:MAG: hypothetical protein R2941_06865 [Desulfobacterales bacterium]
MKEKEIKELGKKASGEKDPVLPKEETPAPGKGMGMAPNFAGKGDAAKPAESAAENMPDIRGVSNSGSEQEEAPPSFGVPNFVRFTSSEPHEKTDTGTLLLSETEDDGSSKDADRENMTIDPNAATVNAPLNEPRISGYRANEKDADTEHRKEDRAFSFDQSTIIAPGGNLEAIRLSDSEEDPPADFANIRKDRERLISELAFEKEETEHPKTAPNGSAFNPDAADTFRSRTDSDFDFVRDEDEPEDRTVSLSDINAETPADPRADNDFPKFLSEDDPDEKTRKDAGTGRTTLSSPDTDRMIRLPSKTDKSQEDDADFLGAAFLAEIPQEEADVDPDALTMIVPQAEFEKPGQRKNGKTADLISENDPAEKNEDETFDLSDMLRADTLQTDRHPEQKEESASDREIGKGKKTEPDNFLSESDAESVFDLDARTVIAPLSDSGRPENEEEAEEEAILELGADAIVEAEEEIPLELGSEAVVSGSGEENFDPDAETVVASAADLLGLESGNLLNPPSEADAADKSEEPEDLTADLLIQDADEGLPDPDSILDTSDAEVMPDDRENRESAGKDRDVSPEESLSAMDILNSMGSSEEREEYRGADNTIGLLDRLNAENAAQPVPEDDYFHMRDTEAGPEAAKKTSRSIRTDSESKQDKKEKEIAKQTPDTSAKMRAAENSALHREESEPVYDSLAGKYYFSLSPAQIEAALERIINRIFSERIEKVLREVVGKAVEEEIKKFREGIIEDIADGDKL